MGVYLVLNGGDLGYEWRLDGTDDETTGTSFRSGRWRVSWIDLTAELHAEHVPLRPLGSTLDTWRLPSAGVWVIGTTPPVSFRQVIDWFAPLEPRQHERNCLAVPFEAFEE